MSFAFKTDADLRDLYLTLNCTLFDRLVKNYQANGQEIFEKCSPFD